MQNGLAESFKGRMRDTFLNETLFRNLAHARERIAARGTDCNTARPRSTLGHQTLAGFALDMTTAIARSTPRGLNDQRASVIAE